MHPSNAVLEQVEALYGRGLYLQAYEIAKREGPLESWRGASARALAGRLACRLGSWKLGRVLLALGWRTHRADLVAIDGYFYVVRERSGPVAAWVSTLRSSFES